MTARTKIEIRQEVRFSVVMYGGVSLAIYINGVVQEIFKLVRANAPDPLDERFARHHYDELPPTERVYRKLGQLLGREGDETSKTWHKNDPIHTKFSVDILSGTSAGGINAIYLAKAIANDQPIDSLEHLWMQEGDICRLINDKKSTRDIPGLRTLDPPRSLLNSQRMFRKLLLAFNQMESAAPSKENQASPYASEIDLFVTTTDIAGIPVALKLTAGSGSEKRHKNVFHLRYSREPGEEQNDFHAEYDPFLAYIARCTSSFPFAFEPMRLVDVADAFGNSSEMDQLRHKLSRFFPAYPLGDKVLDFTQRAFGDGGYLDNKPFSHAIDVLSTRNSGARVQRKLLYIEPKPSVIDSGTIPPPPDAIENVFTALNLPRYETIREDLHRITDRNELIARVEQILSEMEEDVWRPREPNQTAREFIKSNLLTAEKFRSGDNDQVSKEFGIPFRSYERLVVASVTEDLSRWIGAAFGVDFDSDKFVALRIMTTTYRDRIFESSASGDSSREFLFQFNIRFRIRRLVFVVEKIDRLMLLNEFTDRILKLQYSERLDDMDDEGRLDFRTELRRVRDQLNEALRLRRQIKRRLLSSDVDHPLHDYIAALPAMSDALDRVLHGSSPESRSQIAEELFSDRKMRSGWELMDSVLQKALTKVGEEAAKLHKEARKPTPDERPWKLRAREIVDGYWELFHYYDLISFPILYSTSVGEVTNPIDIVRISPLDANLLVDEKQTGRSKLAGTAIMNFGGFLRRSWRWNDILWGKLDGVEQLVTSMLPSDSQKNLRESLVRVAHEVRLKTAFEEKDGKEMRRLLVEQISNSGSDTSKGSQNKISRDTAKALDNIVRQIKSSEELYEYFRLSYRPEPSPEPNEILDALARGTTVVGKLLQGISDSRGIDKRPAAWITRVGGWLWGLVEVAVPRSLFQLFFRYWLKIIYTVEVLLIAAGFFSTPLLRVGLLGLAATIVIHLLVSLAQDVMQGRTRIKTSLTILVGAVVVGLASYGAYSAATNQGVKQWIEIIKNWWV